MLSLSLLLAVTASAEAKPVVSVLYFENQSGNAELDVLRKGFADMVITDLVAWDGVTVVERARLQSVLTELELQQSKGFDARTAARVGKLVGAQYAITGTLLVAQGRLRVDATVTSVEQGTVVASASATDAQDKVFDVEQQLVDALSRAIDWKLKNRDARKKARVPDFAALVAYSKAIDLSDQGRVDEAQKAMAALVSKSPTFSMAREKKLELLEQLKEYEAKKRDLVSGSTLELGKRADDELKQGPVRRDTMLWRAVKGRFLARVLKQSLSSRDESLRVVKRGQEQRALEVMKGWVENQRRFIDEALQLAQSDPNTRYDLDRAPVWEQLRDSMLFDSDTFDFAPEVLTVALDRFVVEGRIDDGKTYVMAPPVSELVPAQLDAVLAAQADAVARAQAAYPRAADKSRAAWALGRAMMKRAETLEYLRRDDDAAAAYQQVLDTLPTSDEARRAEQQLQEIIGTRREYSRGEREKFARAVRDCDDWYVNTEAGWRLRRKGLAGLDELSAEMEKACFGFPGAANDWGRFYLGLAHAAARHDDCALAKKLYLKAFTFGGEGPRSFVPYFKNEPWCEYGLTESTFPSKVRVSRASQGTRGNPLVEAVNPGLEDVIAEELGARGVAVEWGGNSNGGVRGMSVALDTRDEKGEVTLTGKLAREDDEGHDVPVSAVLEGSIDFDAFFAPVLRALRGRSESGPRKPTSKMPVEQVVAYGKAMGLFEQRKWQEARDAFEALAKKYPGFRLAAVRARLAAAKLKRD
ncbi:MAG: tetratricopeptide repeat protein [Archangiaceae bacterium]|nr:tetratricopeptide repeat protein [Archangiaceae bacterium]